MSFHNSAGEINFEGTTLKAGLRAGNGAWYDAEINLDEILGNADGAFEWGGKGFSSSASDIRFTWEDKYYNPNPVLRATLTKDNGEKVEATVNLANRIGNNNGSFHFQ